jgi:hypothetical protein
LRVYFDTPVEAGMAFFALEAVLNGTLFRAACWIVPILITEELYAKRRNRVLRISKLRTELARMLSDLAINL